MKPIKKIFRKSNIFSFLLGAVIFGSVGAVSAYTIFASDVGFTPKNNSWKVDNVSDAIDDLYKNSNTIITELKSSNINKQNTIDEQLETIETLNTRLSSQNEVLFGNFNATEVKDYTITTNFKPSKIIIILPNTTTGFYEVFSYDANIDNNIYACWTNNKNSFGSNTSTNDGCTLVNSLITINNTNFKYSSTQTTLGTTYWYAIK